MPDNETFHIDMPDGIMDVIASLNGNREREYRQKQQQHNAIVRTSKSVGKLEKHVYNIDRKVADLNAKISELEEKLQEVNRKAEIAEEKRYKSDRKYQLWLVILSGLTTVEFRATIASVFQSILEFVLKCLGVNQ